MCVIFKNLVKALEKRSTLQKGSHLQWLLFRLTSSVSIMKSLKCIFNAYLLVLNDGNSSPCFKTFSLELQIQLRIILTISR